MNKRLLFAWVATACSPPKDSSPSTLPDTIPAAVAPLFGLDVLRAGSTPAQVNEALAKARTRLVVRGLSFHDDATDVDVRLRYEASRLGDIVFTFPSCTEINFLLTKKWGTPTRLADALRSQLIWTPSSSPWFASELETSSGARCQIAFTSCDYFGTKPSPPGELQKLPPRTPRSLAITVSSELASSKEAIDSPGIDGGKQVVVYNASNEIENTYLVAPPRALLAIARAWGPGIKLDDGEPRTTWFDAHTGQRATLKDVRLIFDQAKDWKEWLGTGTEIAALGRDYIGFTVGELNAKVGPLREADRNESHQLFELPVPASPWAPESHALASVRVANREVTNVSVDLLYDSRETRAQMLHAFDSKWGNAAKTAAGLEYSVRSRIVDVSEVGGAFLLSISRPR